VLDAFGRRWMRRLRRRSDLNVVAAAHRLRAAGAGFPAHALAGLRVKARAVLWCHSRGARFVLATLRGAAWPASSACSSNKRMAWGREGRGLGVAAIHASREAN
jgi:hypothetical protein